MVAITSELPTALRNRRRRVRHKIQTPAYASFTGESKTAMLDLYEILDISEEGVSIQCPEPLDADRHIDLCLDLAECSDHVYTTGRVVWSNASGRVGLHFSELPPASLFRLREWLFLNAMAGVANAAPEVVPPAATRTNYTDTLAAVSAVQREVEALGADLAAALELIVERAEKLVRASGAAIALATAEPDVMDCRASSGNDAPPVGARLQVGSGFSGECVKSGHSLRCDDSDLDERVDRESCRALGIRSILAIPIRAGEKSIGILEAFSPQPDAFTDADSKVLQRLAESVVPAVNRAARAENLPPLAAEEAPARFEPPVGSVLFASEQEKTKNSDSKTLGGIHLPRSLLILMICAAAICMALGYLSAPYLQAKFEKHGRAQLPTVLASSQPSNSENNASPDELSPTLDTASIDQLRQMAGKGDAGAENMLGLRYFQGDQKSGVKQDEKEAARWFAAAAEHGNVAAQSKLGFLYWSGRGVSKDITQAYLWTGITLLHKTENKSENTEAISLSQSLAQHLRTQLTAGQTKAIEGQARLWFEKHEPGMKPAAGQ
jgi:TPR repeat protein/putative methionine-R-sulfoxide reductase with GAF domain